MSAFPKTMRAAASGIARHLLALGVEPAGSRPAVVAMKDYVAITSNSSTAVEAEWMDALQALPYRTRFTLRRNSDKTLTACVYRLDEVDPQTVAA
jgi:hypothetical protein